MRTISKPHEQKVTKLVQMVDEKTYNVNNSGAPDFKAGDVRGQYILLECKTMKEPQKQQTIKKEFLEKLSEEAFFKKIDINAVVLNFGDIEGEEYFLLDEKSFLDMYYAYIKIKENQ